MANLTRRIDTDDLNDLSVTLEKLSQAVQDAISGGGGGGGTDPTTKGGLITFGTAVEELSVGADGAVLTADSGARDGIDWVMPAPTPYIPGQLVTFIGGMGDSPALLGVGSDGQILSANSANDYGLEWIDAPSGGGGLAPILTSLSDLTAGGPAWVKYDLLFSDFNTHGSTNPLDITLDPMPENCVIIGAVLFIDAAFVGGTVDHFYISVGSTNEGGNVLFSNVDMHSGIDARTSWRSNSAPINGPGGTNNLTIELVTSGDNVSALAGGHARLFVNAQLLV